jgi:hypothetical protein
MHGGWGGCGGAVPWGIRTGGGASAARRRPRSSVASWRERTVRSISPSWNTSAAMLGMLPRWACSPRRRATRDATWNQVIFWLTGGSAGRVLTKVRIEENSNCYCILPRQDWPCCYSFSTPHER